MSAPAKPNRPNVKSIQVVKAMYSYQAQNPDELSFEEGDILYVLNKDDPNWIKCQLKGDKEGLVPANYVGENTATIDNPLHEAAKRGNLEFLSELLTAGISVNGLDKAGNTPLHWACRGGHAEAVRLLLAKGPAINAQNKLGDTPLHAAAWAGNLAIVKLLLDAKDIQINIKNNQNETPLNLAKSDDVAAFLLQKTGKGVAKYLVEDEDDE
jgi:hypothetical protein